MCSGVQSGSSLSVSQSVEDSNDHIADERCNWSIDESDLMLFVLPEPFLLHCSDILSCFLCENCSLRGRCRNGGEAG